MRHTGLPDRTCRPRRFAVDWKACSPEEKKMRKLAWIALAVLVVSGFAYAGDAAKAKTVTLEGSVMCAKCALHEEGRTKCQNVLVVEDDKEKQHYYLSGETNEEFGEVCMASPSVRVTGTLEEKDGQTWIAATEIVAVDEEGS